MTDVDGVMEAAEHFGGFITHRGRMHHSRYYPLLAEKRNAIERAAQLAIYDGIVAVLKEAAADAVDPNATNTSAAFGVARRTLQLLEEYEAKAAALR